jgi:hypothetical protein
MKVIDGLKNKFKNFFQAKMVKKYYGLVGKWLAAWEGRRFLLVANCYQHLIILITIAFYLVNECHSTKNLRAKCHKFKRSLR